VVAARTWRTGAPRQQAQGRIDPESFTHGTSEQRAHWLQTGFDSGKLESCDTFSGDI